MTRARDGSRTGLDIRGSKSAVASGADLVIAVRSGEPEGACTGARAEVTEASSGAV